MLHIERALRSRPRLRESLSHMTYTPGKDTALTTTRCLFMTLRKYPAQDITSLLNNLRSQHAHLIHTGKFIGDPNTDHPYSPLTYAFNNLARTLNIPSYQHSIANPRAMEAHPCPVTTIDIPGTPRMCEYYDLLRHVPKKHQLMTVWHAYYHIIVSTLQPHSLAVSGMPSFVRTHLISGRMRYN